MKNAGMLPSRLVCVSYHESHGSVLPSEIDRDTGIAGIPAKIKAGIPVPVPAGIFILAGILTGIDITNYTQVFTYYTQIFLYSHTKFKIFH